MKGYISLLVGLCILVLSACSQPTQSATNQMNSLQLEHIPSVDVTERMKVYLWEEEEQVMPLISHDETPELTEKHEQLLHLIMKEEEPASYENDFIMENQSFKMDAKLWHEIELIVMDDHIFSDSPIFQLNEASYKRTVAINSLRSRTNSLKNLIQQDKSTNLKEVDIYGL
ncbi:hypothetical protein [Alkalihalophilus marmarensis]|uniref:hypothetical protein n=1 Tax=Alkalihalophilus marmarensis TaxID=521377 RepID=UPI002E1F507B|nr:hypothetical protein [Alkalihalophilus marmarensis]